MQDHFSVYKQSYICNILSCPEGLDHLLRNMPLCKCIRVGTRNCSIRLDLRDFLSLRRMNILDTSWGLCSYLHEDLLSDLNYGVPPETTYESVIVEHRWKTSWILLRLNVFTYFHIVNLHNLHRVLDKSWHWRYLWEYAPSFILCVCITCIPTSSSFRTSGNCFNCEEEE